MELHEIPVKKESILSLQQKTHGIDRVFWCAFRFSHHSTGWPFQVFKFDLEIQPWMEHGWHMHDALVAPIDMMRFPAPPLPPLDREYLSVPPVWEIDTS